MQRRQISHIASMALVLLSMGTSAVAAQSTGFAHFRTYLANSHVAFEDRGVSRMFLQGPNGPEEIFTQEFAPGTHTLSSIEALNGTCRLSATNITFTVTAGQWTEVDVPVRYTFCSIEAKLLPIGDHNADGGGSLSYSVVGGDNSLGVANCSVIQVDTRPFYEWTDFHACQGLVPFNAVVTETATAGLNSLGSFVDTFTADSNPRTYSFGVAFADSTNPHPNGISLVTDVEIKLVSGSTQGFVSNNVFRIINHGPNNAGGVRVARNINDEILSDSGSETFSMSIADGYCDLSYSFGGCFVNFLPAGDSTTVTVRYQSFPAGDNSPENLPGFSANCGTVFVEHFGSPEDTLPPDPNPSNNTAACTTTAVPITVALGGSTPPNHTVAAGSSNVPMIEFVLTPATQQSVTGVTVQASGTGNEQADVTAVHLYLDKNGNGAVDSGDSVVASGTFAANDGTVTLAVNPGLAITAPTALLVTYSFSVTVAERLGGGIVLALLPLIVLPSVRRRKALLAILLVMVTTVAVANCGGDSSGPTQPGGGSVTFSSTLTGVNTSTGSVSNLSVHGATITINK
jgi:hypothetical protein